MTEASAIPEASGLVRALDLIAEIGPDERLALNSLPRRLVQIAAGQDIVREGDHPTECCLLLEGFLCRYKTVRGGHRQILSFHLPGEIPDLQSLYLERMDHSLAALSAGRVAYLPHDAVAQIISRHPRLNAALWKATLIDGSIFREWLATVGRRTAAQRMAHLFCELYLRLTMRGLAERQGFHLPLTRVELGDAMGLTSVHVSRMLKELNDSRLIRVSGRRFAIEDWPRLVAFADFDPTYLHYRRPLPPHLAIA